MTGSGLYNRATVTSNMVGLLASSTVAGVPAANAILFANFVPSGMGKIGSFPLLSDSFPLPSDSFPLPPDSFPLLSDSFLFLPDSFPLLSDSFPILSDSFPLLSD